MNYNPIKTKTIKYVYCKNAKKQLPHQCKKLTDCGWSIISTDIIPIYCDDNYLVKLIIKYKKGLNHEKINTFQNDENIRL